MRTIFLIAFILLIPRLLIIGVRAVIHAGEATHGDGGGKIFTFIQSPPEIYLSFPSRNDGGFIPSAPPGTQGVFIKSGSMLYATDGGFLAVPR